MQGNGTWNEPYLIANTSDFMEFYLKHQPQQWYRLENSIDLRAINWGGMKTVFNNPRTLKANLDLNGYFIANVANGTHVPALNSEDGLWTVIQNATIINGGFVNNNHYYNNPILARDILNSKLSNLFIEINNRDLVQVGSTGTIYCIAKAVKNSIISNISVVNTAFPNPQIVISSQFINYMLNTVLENICFVGNNQHNSRMVIYLPNHDNSAERETHIKGFYVVSTTEDNKYQISTNSASGAFVVNKTKLQTETFNQLGTYEIAPNTPVWITQTGKPPKLGILDYETFFIGLDTGWWTYDPILRECSKVANTGESNLPNSGGIAKGWMGLLTALDWDIIKKHGTLQSIARVNRHPNNKRIGAKETIVQAVKQDNIFTIELDWNQIGDSLLSLGVSYG